MPDLSTSIPSGTENAGAPSADNQAQSNGSAPSSGSQTSGGEDCRYQSAAPVSNAASPVYWIANAEEALPEEDTHFRAFFSQRTSRMFPRFITALHPGDILVTPVPIDRDFAGYLGGIMHLGDPRNFIMDVPLEPTCLIAGSAEKALAGLKPRLSFYTESARSAEVAENLGAQYAGTDIELVKSGLIDNLNDKGWFKSFAASCGVPAVPGIEVNGLDALREAVEKLPYEKIMLRKVKFAGGAGNLSGTKEELAPCLEDWAQGRILAEPFLDIAEVAGTLARITDDGPEIMGQDCQVFTDGHWCGFSYPYCETAGFDSCHRPGCVNCAKHKTSPVILDYSLRIARKAFEMGARGYMNADWAILNGTREVIALECNFRHNGLSYVLDLASALFGAERRGLFIESREEIPSAERSFSKLYDRLAEVSFKDSPLLYAPGSSLPCAVITSPPFESDDGITFSAAFFGTSKEEALKGMETLMEAAK